MPLESAIVKSIMDELKKQGVDCEKTHGGLYGTRGRADIYCLVPVVFQAYPVALYLECKQPWKTSTTSQLAWAKKKRKAGGVVEEVNSLVGALHVVDMIQRGEYTYDGED